MKFDLFKASENLFKLDLKLKTEHMIIDVYWIRVMEVSSKWCINRHRHSSYEFHFVASGGCKVILDNKSFNVKKGDFYITPPGIYHIQTNNECKQYLEYCMNCDIKLISDELSEEKCLLEVLKLAECRPYERIESILELFETVLEEAFYKKIGYYNKIKKLVYVIIVESVRVINSVQANYNVPVKNKEHDYRWKQVEKYIKDNISIPIATKDIANFMHLSDKQLCRISLKMTGVTTKEFICLQKFNKAKELLRDTNYSIREVSEKLGFSSQYYFNQFFKTREGYSPTEFRKNAQYV